MTFQVRRQLPVLAGTGEAVDWGDLGEATSDEGWGDLAVADSVEDWNQ